MKTPEAKYLLSHAIDHGGGVYEIPSASFVEATKITKARLPHERFPPD